MDRPDIPAVEWFFGAGGNHLGLARVLPGLRLIAACEIEAFAVANVVAKMEAGLLDAAPLWTDVRTFPGDGLRDRVALFIASYPCQGESCAGLRKGKRDPRWLWPHAVRGIEAMRPLRCFFENVEGHLTKGLRTVCADLEALGYRVACGVFSAEEVGAPHRRKRVFIMADDERGGFSWPCLHAGPGEEGRGASDTGRPSEDVDNSAGSRCDDARGGAAALRGGEKFPPGPQDLDAWARVLALDPSLEPAVCRVADGLAHRVDRLRLTGNGVVSDTAALAYVTLDRELRG